MITDLYGSKPLPDSPFLIIKYDVDIMVKLEETDFCSIWSVNNKLKKLMELNGLDINTFNIAGHFWQSKQISNPQNVLLVNTNNNVSNCPIDYQLVATYKSGYIWKPICKPGFTSIGMLYNVNKPSLFDMMTIAHNYIIPYHGWYDIVQNITNMNEFSLLGIIGHDRLTIDRTMLLTHDTKMSIVNNNGKITPIVNSSPIISNNDSSWIYTKSGEIKFNDDCLTNFESYKKDGFVYLRPCGGSQTQKWFFSGNNDSSSIVSQYDHTCIAEKNGYLKSSTCNNNDNQLWKKINEEIIIINEPQKRRAILVESDNPWYINKQNTQPAKIYNPSQSKNIKKHADFRSFTNDKLLINKGGTSLQDRLHVINAKCTEAFDDPQQNDSKPHLIVLCIILCILFLYIRSKKA